MASLLSLIGLGAMVAPASTPPVIRAAVAATVGTARGSTRSKAQGGSGDRIIAGLVDDLDANPDVRAEKWFPIADEMLRDGHVRKSLDYIKDPLLQSPEFPASLLPSFVPLILVSSASA